MTIIFAQEPHLDALAFIDLLQRSGLAARRPVTDVDRIDGMLRHADLILTARTPLNELVGVSRAITDFHYCTYLSDLAVDVAFQRRGIGKHLIDFSHDKAGRNTKLILLSAPAAATYYPHIGMTQHDSCWTTK